MTSFEWPSEGGAGGGVTSLNTLTGDVIIAAGTGISVSGLGNTITIATSALLAAITSINSDSTSAQVLSVGTAGTDFHITDAGSGSHVFNLPTASASNRGALSSADWSTFNGKQPTGNYATSGTGDVSWSAPSGAGPVTTSLVATTNSTLATLSGLTTASSLASIGTITAGVWHGTAIGAQWGGTGIDTHASTGVPSINAGTWSVAATLAPTLGGTGIAAYTTGDILYASATNTLARLAVGSAGNVLTVSTGVPAWAPPATSGTVTSVAMTGDGTVFNSSVTGSPITSAGTLAPSLVAQAKNTVLAGPSSGPNAASTFRAQVYADVSPALKLPNVVTFTSSGTYTPSSSPAPLYAIIECIGAGGGGGASGTGGGTGGSAGGTTTFGSFISITGGALGGDGDGPSPGGVPTLTTSGTAIAIYSVAGGQGQGSPAGALNVGGGQGGSSFLGGAGGGGEFGAGTAGGNGATNSGGGGGGAGSTTGLTSSGSGGGGGGFGKMLLTGSSIASTAVTLGNGGTGQTAGSSGQAGGNGAKGQCTVIEYFQ